MFGGLLVRCAAFLCLFLVTALSRDIRIVKTYRTTLQRTHKNDVWKPPLPDADPPGYPYLQKKDFCSLCLSLLTGQLRQSSRLESRRMVLDPSRNVTVLRAQYRRGRCEDYAWDVVCCPYYGSVIDLEGYTRNNEEVCVGPYLDSSTWDQVRAYHRKKTRHGALARFYELDKVVDDPLRFGVADVDIMGDSNHAFWKYWTLIQHYKHRGRKRYTVLHSALTKTMSEQLCADLWTKISSQVSLDIEQIYFQVGWTFEFRYYNHTFKEHVLRCGGGNSANETFGMFQGVSNSSVFVIYPFTNPFTFWGHVKRIIPL